MLKVMFTRTVKVAQGDGKGPTFEAGKAYWLREGSVAYWRSEDAITDAPADMVAENEQGPEPIRSSDVRLERAGRNRFNVVVRGVTVNDEPVKGDEAERLRARALAGDAEVLARLNPAPAPAAAPTSPPAPEAPEAEVPHTEPIADAETQSEAAPVTDTEHEDHHE